ncbi:M35 family metallo-endopeptidase [Massilia sp. W12]|uniref:M35 family metallo-endopeptidase n=1 Tax=Massilia sp. W12 TaxID=3126507 RepID=UPI0030CD92A9
MDLFTEVHKKNYEVIKKDSFPEKWKQYHIKFKIGIRSDAPSKNSGQIFDIFRQTIRKESSQQSKKKNDLLLTYAESSAIDFQQAAALYKSLLHFYQVRKKGNQTIWVMDFPKRYTAWTFDLYEGKRKDEIKSLLAEDEEVFGPSNRKTMSDALQLSRKWALDACHKLSSPSIATKEIVKRWFHSGSPSEASLQETITTLLQGFKNIARLCNSGDIIFSDRPHLRAKGTMSDVIASVNQDDVLPVIYIYEAFMEYGKRNKAGKIPQLWFCSLTIIHELSHRVVKTDDKRYDYSGLKPGPSFSDANALINADSWAYFATDLAGMLTKGTLESVLF